MTSPFEEVVDSRTSTIGRKHHLESPEALGEKLDDDYPENSRKRMRQDSNGEGDLLSTSYANSENLNTQNPPVVERIASLEAAIPSNTKDGVIALESTSVSSSVAPQISWNQGVQGGIRTSFGSRGSSLHLQPRALPATLNTVEESLKPKIVDLDQKVTSQDAVRELNTSRKKKMKGKKKNNQIVQSAGHSEAVQSLPGNQTNLQLPEESRGVLPRKLKGKQFRYAKVAWDLSPVSGNSDSVLSLGDLSFEQSFIPHFIQMNQTHVDRLGIPCLKQAFLSYIRSYYNNQPAVKYFKLYLKGKDVENYIETAIADARSLHSKQRPNNDGGDSSEGRARDALPLEPPTDVKPSTERSRDSSMSADMENLGALEEALSEGSVDDQEMSGSDEELDILEGPGAEHERGSSAVDLAQNGTDGTSFQVPKHEVSNGTESPGLQHRIEMDRLEIAAVERYFPGLPDVTSRATCLTCAQRGHSSLECPRLTCGSCGLQGIHFTEACPQTQRCTKCRKQGHQKATCPEKLAAASTESGLCDLCKVADHVESACPLVWRTYKPSIFSITKVQALPISCYSCGADGHFGPDCGLRRSKLLTGGSTWSQSNRAQYIEVNSSMRALSAGKDLTVRPRFERGINIKGKSHHNQDAIDSESDSGDFIRPKINVLPHSQGHIRFNTGRGPSDRGNASSIQGSFPSSRLLPPRASQANIPQGPRRNHETASDRRDDHYGRYARERTFSPPPRYPDEGRFQERSSQRSRGKSRRGPPRSHNRGGRQK